MSLSATLSIPISSFSSSSVVAPSFSDLLSAGIGNQFGPHTSSAINQPNPENRGPNIAVPRSSALQLFRSPSGAAGSTNPDSSGPQIFGMDYLKMSVETGSASRFKVFTNLRESSIGDVDITALGGRLNEEMERLRVHASTQLPIQR